MKIFTILKTYIYRQHWWVSQTTVGSQVKVEGGLELITAGFVSSFKETAEIWSPASSGELGSFSPHDGQNLKSGCSFVPHCGQKWKGILEGQTQRQSVRQLKIYAGFYTDKKIYCTKCGSSLNEYQTQIFSSTEMFFFWFLKILITSQDKS